MRRVEVIPKIWVGVAPTHPTRNQTHGVVQPEAWLIAKMSHGSMLLIFQYTVQLIHDIIESTGHLIHCLPVPLNSVIPYQVLHMVAEVVGLHTTSRPFLLSMYTDQEGPA